MTEFSHKNRHHNVLVVVLLLASIGLCPTLTWWRSEFPAGLVSQLRQF
jgi:hypothetical protein